MKRVDLSWGVGPSHWEEYNDIHLNTWPELIEAIHDVGIHNYDIFAFGTGISAYMDVGCEDAYAALGELAKTDIKKKWDNKVAAWIMPEAEDGIALQFMELESIFYRD